MDKPTTGKAIRLVNLFTNLTGRVQFLAAAT